MNNSLAEVHPELVSEWSEKNIPLTPDDITFGSNKKVWWRGACGHEWQTSVKARSNGEKCPICSGARVIAGINDLATLEPLLVKQWSKKNKIKPTEVSIGSHKKVIWRCEKGHEWEAAVKSRTINKTGCPYCSHNKVLAGFNDLAAQLDEAVANIHGEITEYETEEELEEEDNSIPADPTVRNFSYTVVDDKIYYRENSRMTPVEVSATAENRIKGMIAIRNSVRTLIELQTEDYSDSEIKAEQERLNRLYDTFSGKYGLINSRANTSAFSQDSSFSLLSALEIIGEDGELERKSDYDEQISGQVGRGH